MKEHYDVLFNNGQGCDYRQKINDMWLQVAQDCMDNRVNRFFGKDAKALREDVYRRKVNGVRAKWDNSRKPGSAGVTWKPVIFYPFINDLISNFLHNIPEITRL